MKKNEILIVYNMYGFQDNNLRYFEEIDKILLHIQNSKYRDDIRLVISAVLKSDDDIEDIKNRYGKIVKIFKYNRRYPVQVSFNKTVTSSIIEFDENYNGYLYISAGVLLNNDYSLLDRLIEKNNTNEFGIIHLHVDDDHGPFEPTNYNEDTFIELGYWCNLNITLFNKSLLEFFEKPMSDIFSISASESPYSFVCSSLRKHYIIMENSTCEHKRMFDSKTPDNIPNEFDIKEGFMWNRKKDFILNDFEAIKSGIGLRNEAIIVHDPTKYDNKNLSLDSNLKYYVKKHFFSNDSEINYNYIKYEII